MIPPDCSGCMTIVDAKGVTEGEVIASEISREIDVIFFVEFIIGLYVEIVKIKAVTVHAGVR